MNTAEMRAAIADARAQEMDPEARPWLVCKIVRDREPKGRRVRVLPGVTGEVLSAEPTPFVASIDGDGFNVRPGVRIAVRVFCDDLERWLDRHTASPRGGAKGGT
jgi:hypothetical protein